MTTLYVATDEGVAVLTTDEEGGLRPDGLQIIEHGAQCVTVDPRRPERVYTGTFGEGIRRTIDRGRSWEPVGTDVVPPTVLSVAVATADGGGGPGIVYAGTEPSEVYRSDDGGDTWRVCAPLTDLPSSSHWSFPPRPSTHHVRWIHPEPGSAARLWVAIEAGALVHSADGGCTWTDRVSTAPLDSHQLSTHRATPGRIRSAAGDGYFESGDGGVSWAKPETGLAHRYLWSLAADPADPGTVLVSAADSATRSHDPERAESFIYRRAEPGAWEAVGDGLPAPSGRRTAVLAADPVEGGAILGGLGARHLPLDRRGPALGAGRRALAGRLPDGRAAGARGGAGGVVMSGPGRGVRPCMR